MASIERQSVPEALREEDTSAGESTAFSSPVEFAVDLNARPPLTNGGPVCAVFTRGVPLHRDPFASSSESRRHSATANPGKRDPLTGVRFTGPIPAFCSLKAQKAARRRSRARFVRTGQQQIDGRGDGHDAGTEGDVRDGEARGHRVDV